MDVNFATRCQLGAAFGILSLLAYGVVAGYVTAAWRSGTPEPVVLERMMPILVSATVLMFGAVILQRRKR